MKTKYTTAQFLIEFSVFFYVLFIMYTTYPEVPFVWRFLAAYGAGEVVGTLYYSGKLIVEAVFNG